MIRRRRQLLVSTVAVVLLAVGTLVLVAGLSSGRTAAAAAAPPARSAAEEPLPPSQRAACPETSVACVDLDTKQAWLQRNGTTVYGPVPMLPGTETGERAPGPDSSATPAGSFSVQRKDADAHSSEFDQPMPNAVYFAPGGIAFHEGSLTKTSNGCIHLGPEASKTFFDQLKIGDGVTVF